MGARLFKLRYFRYIPYLSPYPSFPTFRYLAKDEQLARLVLVLVNVHPKHAHVRALLVRFEW